MDIPITVISGYLGAGKTSLVNHVLNASHGLRIAVLVNDFGDVNIDSHLIARTSDDTISLTNGCVCCTMQDDLGAAIDRQVQRDHPPEHIVIEASGVAEPARILRYATAWPGVRLDAVVVLVDAETVRDRADDKFVGRVVRRQLAAADFLVLNKRDLISDDTCRDVATWLASVAPRARRIMATRGYVDATLILENAQPTDAGAIDDQRAAGLERHVDFVSITIPVPEAIDVNAFEMRCRDIPESVHRVKGFITDAGTGRLLLFQRVGHRQSLTAVAPQSRPGSLDVLVAIGTSRSDLDQTRNLIIGSAVSDDKLAGGMSPRSGHSYAASSRA